MSESAEKFRAAFVQLRSESQVERNLDAAEAAIRSAAGDGAAYVQTPENTSLMVLKTRELFEKTMPEQDN
ncbi:MAG: carbon-nitrogen hydrolase family protein, partial [Pseudomonadota bacterium]